MRPKISGAYNKEQVYLEYFGFRNVDKKSALTHFLLKFSLMFPIVYHMFAMIWHITTNFDDPAIVQIILYFGTHVGAIFKLCNFIIKSKCLAKIEILLEKPTFNAQDIYNDEFISQSNKRMHLFAKSFKISVYLTLTLFGILGIIHSSLPFGGIYFPGQEKYYYFMVVFQMFGMYQIAVCNSTIDSVSVIFMQLASNQFDILKAQLKNIKYTNDKDVSKKLKVQIAFHQQILEYCELVEELLHNGILAQFLSSAISICFSLLQLIMIPFNFKMFIILLYLVCILCQLWMYCWFGQFVLVKSSEVIDACYTSEWYKCHPKMKSLFFLIMERSKKPTYFTAGKFFILSLTTFVTILKSSYSYFAVLQRMYEG